MDKYAADNESAHRKIQWYDHRTRFLTSVAQTPWKLGRYENGHQVTQVHRKIFRDREDLSAAFPDPYLTPDNELCYLTWLRKTGALEFPELLSPGESQV